MANWWKFGKGRRDLEAGPEETPAPPEPEPQPEPEPEAPSEQQSPRRGGRLRGLLSRLGGKTRKTGRKAPPEEATDAESEPPEPPPAETGAPLPAGEPRPGEASGRGGGGGGEEVEEEYPSSLYVSAYGHWVISSTSWRGKMSGTLHGAAVAAFCQAMKRGDTDTAVCLIAEAYGIPDGLLDPAASDYDPGDIDPHLYFD